MLTASSTTARSLTDVTDIVAASTDGTSGTLSAVVEPDFNNDRLMDLCLVCTNSHLVTQRGPLDVVCTEHVASTEDMLLMKGAPDVSAQHELPRDTDSTDVPAKDVNIETSMNRAWRLRLMRQILSSSMSRARGFTGLRAAGGAPKVETRRGHNVRAADYDGDGKVDKMLSQGCRKEFSGGLWLMRNEIELDDGSHYLFVKEGNETRGWCKSINALASLSVGPERMMRRVSGEKGGADGRIPNIDTVDINVGAASKMDRVMVRWTSGGVRGLDRCANGQDCVVSDVTRPVDTSLVSGH